jgi:hypothetical protein
MSRQSTQNNNYGFTVVQEQLTHKGRGLPLFGNFRTDTGEFLGAASENYGLVQNTELLDAARTALDTRGLTGYREKVIVADKGQRMYAEFSFQNKQLASAVGDVFGYVLRMKNSFDRTLRASFELGMLRLACLNGAATMEKEFGINKKHSSGVSVQFIAEAVDKAINKGQDAIKVYDQLATVPITDQQGDLILRNLELRKLLSGSLRECIRARWLNPSRNEDKARNIYNLYNAVTEHLTHVVAAERYEYAQKTNNNVFLALVNAARQADNLAALLKPIESDAIEVIDVEVSAPASVTA